MEISGHCHCGKISFTAHVDPTKLNICHCTDCQSLSGSPWRASIPTRASDFTLTSGELRVYIKTAESGGRRQQTFCGDCGSPIYSAAEHDSEFFSLRIGVIDQRDQFKPAQQIWTRSALAWSRDISGVPGQLGNAS